MDNGDLVTLVKPNIDNTINHLDASRVVTANNYCRQPVPVVTQPGYRSEFLALAVAHVNRVVIKRQGAAPGNSTNHKLANRRVIEWNSRQEIKAVRHPDVILVRNYVGSRASDSQVDGL